MDLVKVTLKEVIKTLNEKKNAHEGLRLQIADQFRDNQLEAAKENIKTLEALDKVIEDLENLEVEM